MRGQKHRMRHCHEKDSKNADPAPGGGYGIEDVPGGKLENI